MAKESSDALERFRRIVDTILPKDESSASASVMSNFSDSNQIKEGTPLLFLEKGLIESGAPEKRVCTESNSSKAASTWQAEKMKIDLIAAKAQIVSLEMSVKHQHTINMEMQILFEQEKASLVDQHKRDERDISDMKERLQSIQRREQELKEDYATAIKEHDDSKLKWEKDRNELQNQIAELKDKLLEANVSSKGQLSQMKKDMNELLQALEAAQQEVEILKIEVAKQTARAEQCITLRIQVEKQTFELQSVTDKLKRLEYERDSYKDWQQQAKTAERRLINMAELEKEVVRLRAKERSLRDAMCNTLVLEEQVHLLTQKVEALQPVQQELYEAKVKLASLESSLEEWKSAAQAHGAQSARALSSVLDSALSSQLTSQSQFAQLTEEAVTLKFERDKATAKLNDLQFVRKNQDSLIDRLEKRLLLVTKERDSYRQQLESYEKNLTFTQSGATGKGSAAILSARVEQLEKALQGYRDVLANQDHESQAKDNPAALAQNQMNVDLESAQEEIKKLKAALREGGNRACPEELQQLCTKLENSQIKLQRMKEEFTSLAQEYRDACYMLLGYKLNRTGHKNYRLSNMYAESSDEYLTFTLCDDGIKMVHTDYTASLGELVELHLHRHHSIPVFLSALTMELFTRTTMQKKVQEC